MKLVYKYSLEWLAVSCLKLYFAFLLKSKKKQELLDELEREHEKELARQKAMELEGKTMQQKKEKVLTDKDKTELIAVFMMSVVWSVGALLDSEQRGEFSDWAKAKLASMEGCSKELKPPEKSSIYEVVFE